MELAISIAISLLGGFVLGYAFANMNSKKLLKAQEDILTQEKEKLDTIKKEMENSFKAIASDVSKSNTEEFLKLANDKFQSLSKESDINLEEKKKLIDQNLQAMTKKLDSIQKQSTELNTNLESSKEETRSLRDTTTKLREILSSSHPCIRGVKSKVNVLLESFEPAGKALPMVFTRSSALCTERSKATSPVLRVIRELKTRPVRSMVTSTTATRERVRFLGINGCQVRRYTETTYCAYEVNAAAFAPDTFTLMAAES